MRVISFLLKSIVGVFAVIGILVVVGVIGAVLLWEQFEPWWHEPPSIPARAVLALDLTNGVTESRPSGPFALAARGGDTPVLRDVVQALDEAAADERIGALLVRLGRGNLSLATVQELRDAVTAFGASGRPTIAFAETFGEGGDGTTHYYLASAFDRIWLQPSGDVGIVGIAIETPFVREALSEIGITPRFDQRGAYKGAMNTVTDRAMPEPQRRNLQALLDSALDQVVRGIAERRSLDAAAVRALIDRAPHGAAEALEVGLVDQLGYWDEVRAATLEAADLPRDDDDGLLDLRRYAEARDEEPGDGPVVALVYGLGPVTLDESESDPIFGRVTMGADTVAQAIADAAEDTEVRAILFRIDSPGGSYIASDTIWREVQRARERGVPVIVSMGGVAASGGYFVAAPAHKIVAQPATITGSIGVVTGKVVLSDLWTRIGVNWDGVQAGEHAGLWSPNRDFTPEEWATVQESLDRVYADFTQKVADGRNMPIDDVLAVAEGRVWTGEDAKARGLVDELGGYRTALALAREAAEIPADTALRLREFPEAQDPLEAILDELLAGGFSLTRLATLAHALARLEQVAGPMVDTLERLTVAPEATRVRSERRALY